MSRYFTLGLRHARSFIRSGSGDTIAAKVQPGTTIRADEANPYDVLASRFLTKRIDHSVEYSNGDARTNQVESFFSRLRRAEVGIHHHIAGRYLGAYASEMAWREDNLRVSNREQFLAVTGAALGTPLAVRGRAIGNGRDGLWRPGLIPDAKQCGLCGGDDLIRSLKA